MVKEYIEDAISHNERKKLGRLMHERDGPDADPDSYIDSTLTYGENLTNLGFDEQPEQTTTRTSLRAQGAGQYKGFVEETTGMTFRSDLGGEKDFHVLQTKMVGKGCEITIRSAFLTNQDTLKNACAMALQHVGQAIVGDVTSAKKSVFADQPPKNTINAYGGDTDYYHSRMVPFWRGGIIGSFALLESTDRLTTRLGFTSPYAELIEEGGSGSEPPPAWSADKDAPAIKPPFQIRAHPFTGAVAMKLDDNLQTFGYLDIFATSFAAPLR